MPVHHTEGFRLGGCPNQAESTVSNLSAIESTVTAFRQHVRQWYAQRGHEHEKPLVYFRGVRGDTYGLVPKIGRNRSENEACRQEKAMLELFLAKLRALYGDTRARGARKQMAMRLAGLFSELGPDNDVDSIPGEWQLPLLAMAQHYGVSTRLLDWSECPSVAVYFAVHDDDREKGSDSSLYMFHDRMAVMVAGARLFPQSTVEFVRPFRIHSDTGKYGTMWRDIIGLDETNRLENQKAVLTVQPRISKRLNDQLVEHSLSPDGNPRYQTLRRVTIPTDRKRFIRDELATKGITYDGLFTGPFEKLCRDVRKAFPEPIGK